jgi:hypothetical protein
MDNNHDHGTLTHEAKCDETNCNYVAKTHAHDNEDAVNTLSVDLALHNSDIHGVKTDPEKIKDSVRVKMRNMTGEV